MAFSQRSCMRHFGCKIDNKYEQLHSFGKQTKTRKHNKKPAIIKKYYPEHVDEHNLINNSLDCLFLNKQRSKAINSAEKKQYDVAILDDGFQDFTIRPNFSILCFNSKQLIGNGFVIPSGPLREPLSAVFRADCIFKIQQIKSN